MDGWSGAGAKAEAQSALAWEFNSTRKLIPSSEGAALEGWSNAQTAGATSPCSGAGLQEKRDELDYGAWLVTYLSQRTRRGRGRH